MTLDDDEEIEILHDSPAAAEESAPHIPPDSVSDVPERSGSALAKQVEATSLMSTAYVLRGLTPLILYRVKLHPLMTVAWPLSSPSTADTASISRMLYLSF